MPSPWSADERVSLAGNSSCEWRKCIMAAWFGRVLSRGRPATRLTEVITYKTLPLRTTDGCTNAAYGE